MQELKVQLLEASQLMLMTNKVTERVGMDVLQYKQAAKLGECRAHN